MAKRKQHKPSSLHLAVLAGIASINANAVGLGEIAVRSRLNEPLRADVPLNDLEPKFADRAQVRFHAPPVDAAGSTNSSVVSKLTGRVVRGKDGIVLEIRSRGTIREPVVSFHVELILPNAHTRREYTVLLDPPAEARENLTASAPVQGNPYDFAAMERNIDQLAAAPGSKRNRKARAPAVVAPNEAATPVSENSSPPPKARSKPATATAVPATAKVVPVSTGPAFTGEVYGPVVKNETLWSIARKVRPNREMSMFDVMQLIFAENPHAFVKNDMNRLRVGVTLTIPSFGGGDTAVTADASPAGGSAGADTSAAAPAMTPAEPPMTAPAAPGDAPAAASGEAATTTTAAATSTSSTPTAAATTDEAAVATAEASPGATTPTADVTTATATTPVAASDANPTQATTDPSLPVVQQADAMQAQLNALAKRLETMQTTLAERETKIANLERTLTDLNSRLKEAQTRDGAPVDAVATTTAVPAAPAGEVEAPAGEVEAPAGEVEAPAGEVEAPAGEVEAPAPVVETAAAADPAPQPVADAAPGDVAAETAFYEGIRLPDNTWVWGMSAAVIAGLGAAFLARRRRSATKGAPTPVATAASPSVVAAAKTEADARRAEKIISEIAPPAEDYQRTIKLERPVVAASAREPRAAGTASGVDSVDAFNATAIDIAPTEPTLGETNTLAWEDNNTVPNWSLERTIERTLEETGETLAQTRTEPFLPELQVGGAPAAAPTTSKVVPIKLDAARVEPVLKEVDLQMAYLQFEDAERLLMQPLQENPNEPSLLVKLAEVHVAAGNIDRFVDLAVRLSKIPEVREGADWKKIARMGEMVAPNHPLFEFVDTVELTGDGFNVASNG